MPSMRCPPWLVSHRSHLYTIRIRYSICIKRCLRPQGPFKFAISSSCPQAHHPKDCRNDSASSCCAVHFLHILFYFGYCPNFGAKLHSILVRMGMHLSYVLWLLFDLVYCIQSFNSVGQSPCTVIGYMMGTCNGGCEFFD